MPLMIEGMVHEKHDRHEKEDRRMMPGSLFAPVVFFVDRS